MAKHISRLNFTSKVMTNVLSSASVSQSSFSPICSSAAASSYITNDNSSLCPFNNKSSSMVNKMPISPLPESSRPFKSIPSPKGLPIIGTVLDLMKAGGAEFFHTYCDSRHRQLGPIYREKMGNTEVVFIADARLMQKVYQFEGKYPQHLVPEPWTIYNEIKGVQRGLFFMDGPEWNERRRSLNKLLLKPTTISEYGDVFNDVISDLLKRWDTMAVTGEAKLEHLERELYNWSIESLGTMIFGRRLGCVEPNNADSSAPLSQIHDFVHWVQQIFVESAKMTMVPPRLAYALNLSVWKRFVKAADTALELARRYVQENVNEIKKNGNDNIKEHIQGQGIIRQMLEEENIDHEEIVRIITDLFIAAADTVMTSHATQWALYLLSKNPQCQERLRNEVNRVTGGDIVNERHLAQLPYVKGVIKEALRLYPVAPFLSRILTRDLELGGYHIPSGKLIAMSLYTTGRETQYFSSPEEFRPERWIRDKETCTNEVTNGHACLPFGHGVRSCIGRRVAELQMQFLLSRIVQMFELSPETPKEIGIKLRMITTPEEPIHLIIKKRN